ncbi:hypothetical protein E4U09_005566 [Claviceps aff. purpurea]|uniref:Uncharacterized protein n=1 Tax=Claviceps aff. purpurea TaxID=1967640 RepID=A0A9P7QBX4_9HYPO|nr:hypothetical protein E4U09_005566 [Claviceps aff. purpurea]
MSNPVKEALTGAYNNMVKSLAEFGMATTEPERIMHDEAQAAKGRRLDVLGYPSIHGFSRYVMALKKCHHSELERREEIRKALQRGVMSIVLCVFPH